MISPGLWLGPVMHRRLRPRHRKFSYSTLWVALDLDRLQSRNRFFSINRLVPAVIVTASFFGNRKFRA